mgnify:CR=1 FL=1
MRQKRQEGIEFKKLFSEVELENLSVEELELLAQIKNPKKP